MDRCPTRVGHARPRNRRPAAEVEAALAGADLVIVENLCSLPLNPGAAAVVAAACAGRPTVLHHHDLPWQRPQLAHLPPPPDDPAWAHVTINELSRDELAPPRHRGHARSTTPSTRIRRRVIGPPSGALSAFPRRRHSCCNRRVHWPRKNIGGAIALAEAPAPPTGSSAPPRTGTGRSSNAWSPGALSASLLGPPARRLLHRRRLCGVRRRPAPLAVGGLRQPVGGVGDATGGRWPSARTRWRRSWRPSASTGSTRPTPPRWRVGSSEPDLRLIAHNHQVAADHFNLADLPARLSAVLGARPGSLTVR